MSYQTTQAQLTAGLCRESLADFVRTFWPVLAPGEPLDWNWHIQVMADELQRCYERVFVRREKEYDLLTNVPPGSTKSIIHSIAAPAWAWTRMPTFCTIGVSYSDEVAFDLCRRTRDVVKSPLYRTLFPAVRVRPDQDTKHYFMSTAGGYRYSAGSGGSVTAFHGHAIIIDDPINPTEVASEATLAATNRWIRDTLLSRKKDERLTFIDMVMQRLHQDDPSAQMLTWSAVRHLCLPCTTDFPVRPARYRRLYQDGLLDPVRRPRAVLSAKQHELGPYAYAGQYGQTPVPAGGGKFKTDRLRWGLPPVAFRRGVRFWDKASSLSRKRRTPRTVGVKMGLDAQNRPWVLDVIRGQWDSAAREDLILRTALADGRGTLVGIEQEPGSGGEDSAKATAARLAAHGLRCRIIKARQSKEVRADEFSVAVNNGLVYLPESQKTEAGWQGWAREFVEELTYWPFSTTLDQGDAAGGAYTLLALTRLRVGPARPKNAGLPA
jgi:predicted phage terminase large subunit-like protein